MSNISPEGSANNSRFEPKSTWQIYKENVGIFSATIGGIMGAQAFPVFILTNRDNIAEGVIAAGGVTLVALIVGAIGGVTISFDDVAENERYKAYLEQRANRYS